VEFSISPVAVLAVEDKIIIHLSIVVAMDEFVKCFSIVGGLISY
jgi:hypothetical protein